MSVPRGTGRYDGTGILRGHASVLHSEGSSTLRGSVIRNGGVTSGRGLVGGVSDGRGTVCGHEIGAGRITKREGGTSADREGAFEGVGNGLVMYVDF